MNSKFEIICRNAGQNWSTGGPLQQITGVLASVLRYLFMLSLSEEMIANRAKGVRKLRFPSIKRAVSACSGLNPHLQITVWGEGKTEKSRPAEAEGQGDCGIRILTEEKRDAGKENGEDWIHTSLWRHQDLREDHRRQREELLEVQPRKILSMVHEMRKEGKTQDDIDVAVRREITGRETIEVV